MARFISKSCLALAVLIPLFVALPLGAQSAAIRMEGTVWNLSDEPLPGAILSAVEENTGLQYESVSDEDGYYRFLALPPGRYTVTVKAKGFKDVMHRGIHLNFPGSLQQDFVFEASPVDREVGPQDLPRLNDGATTEAIPQRELDSMPLMERDPLSLLVYQPGVLINGGNEATSTVNGTRQAMNSIAIDGISVTDPIEPMLGFSLMPMSPDSLSVIQVVTTGAKAEYGRSGGAQFMMVSRSGSKKWSGSLYDYFRSRRLNANDFFNNSFDLPRPGLSRNIYGGTLSGHIGEKTLVFGNFEGNHTEQQVISNRQILTDEARSGIFRWYEPGDATRDETTLRSYDIVKNDPRGLGIDPAVAAALAKLPDPQYDNEFNDEFGDVLNTRGYRFDNPAPKRGKRVAARVDYSRSKDHRLFFRVNWDNIKATDLMNGSEAPYLGEPEGLFRQNNWGIAVGSDWILNPQMVNEFRVGYLRPETKLERAARSASAMFLANSWTNPLDPSFPRSYKSPALEIADNLSRGMGRHALKVGATYRRTVHSFTDYSGVYPNVTFGLNHGNAPDESIGPAERSEISIDDRETFEFLYNDLLGRMESVSQTFNSSLTSVSPAGTPRERDYAFQEFAAYVQDDWKVKPNLTVSLGLRYELSTVPKETNDLQAVLDKAGQISNSANISDFGVVSGNNWYSKNTSDFAPRVGFAWDVYSTGKTIVRGSYGIYYDRLIGALTNFVDQYSYGFSQSPALYPNSGETDLRLSDGVPVISQPAPANLTLPATRSAGMAIFDANVSTPRIQQVNLSLEKSFWGAIWEMGYVGSQGKKLFQHLNLNQTKTDGDFLSAFKEIQAYRESGTPVSEGNTLVHIFGSPLAATIALGGKNVSTGQAGAAADSMDRTYFGSYAAAGVSDYYIRNFPQFDKLIVGSSVGASSYNALQLGMRTSGKSHQLRLNYTIGKSRDSLSSDGAKYVSTPNSLDVNYGKTPSDFDRKHVFNATFYYKFPLVRTPDSDMPGWLSALFADWNISAHYIRQSGPRFSVTTDRETVYGGVKSLADFRDFETNQDPSSMGEVISTRGGVFWFSEAERAMFTFPVAGENGTSGRNTFKGPMYVNLDVALFKSFPVRERSSIQFRIEGYNIFNRAHFSLPDADLSSDTFGKITSTVGTPRSLQVALRFQF